jgi:hypothetical protein
LAAIREPICQDGRMIASFPHASGRGPRATRAVVAGAALLTLSGCLQADFGVTLNDDESGQFAVRMVINREQFAEIEEMFGGMTGEDSTAPEDPCESLMEEDLSADELPPGAEVEPIDDGEWCGGLVTIPFADLDEFNELAADFNSSSEDEEAGFGTIALTRTDGGYRFDVTEVALSDEGMGLGGESEDMEGMEGLTEMFEQLLGDMRITYDVRLPGAPIDHNADAVEGNRFHWDLEWGDERNALFAETGPGEPDGSADTGEISDADSSGATGSAGDAAPGADDDGSSLTWLWILLGVAAVAAVVAIILIKRNKDKAAGTAPIGVPPGAGATAGGSLAPPPPPPGATGDLPPHGQPSPGWQPPSDT